ncbi:unannotated protein [freshwater metagenome]|uniref:Unannotated protein n=1 Tax=freshwater metagenome TaxID=449393 RepID=A0A6J7K3K0_9ZZZZ
MYATVRRYENTENTENTAAIIANTTERFVPMLRAHAGFVSNDIVDAGGGVLITRSVFDTEADARVRRGSHEIRRGVPDLEHSRRTTDHRRAGRSAPLRSVCIRPSEMCESKSSTS